MKKITLSIFLIIIGLLLFSCNSPSQTTNTNNNTATGPLCEKYELHKFGEWIQVNDSSCSEEGQKYRICSLCGAKEFNTSKTLEHTFGEWVEIKASTCSAEGARERVCAVCNHKESEAIPCLEHTVAEWKTEKRASCINAGTESGTCSVCKNPVTRNAPAATGHIYYAYDVTGATLTTAGKTSYKCSKCYASKTEESSYAEKNVDTGIIVEAKSDTFDGGTTLKASKLAESSTTYQTVKNAFSGKNYIFTVYSVEFTKNGSSSKPKNNITLYLPIEASKEHTYIAENNLAVYSISDNGSLVKIAHTYAPTCAIVSGTDGTYIVVDQSPALNQWTELTGYTYHHIAKKQTLDTGTGGPLGMGGFFVEKFSSKEELANKLNDKNFDLTVIDTNYPQSYAELLGKYTDEFFKNNIVLIVCDYIPNPSYLNIKNVRVSGNKLEIVTQAQRLSDVKSEDYYFYGFILELPKTAVENVTSMATVAIP